MARAFDLGPKRQIVFVIVGVVEKPSFLDDAAMGVDTGPPDVSAKRSFAGQAGDDFDGFLQLLTLNGFRHVAVIDPSVTMAANFVAGGEGGLGDRLVAGQCHGNGKNGDWDGVSAE